MRTTRFPFVAALLAMALACADPVAPIQAADPPAGQPADAAAADRTAAERAIQVALAQKIDLSFNERPLADVVLFLKAKHHLPVQFDAAALRDAAVDPTTTDISIQLKGITLRSVLKLMLEAHNLAYVVEDESLVVTTNDQAAARLVTKIHEVRDLLLPDGAQIGPPSRPGEPDYDYDSLIDLIVSVVAPGSWPDATGPGTIQRGLMGTVVFAQTAEVHEEVAALFSAMRQMKEQLNAGKLVEPIIIGRMPADKAIEDALSKKVDLEFADASLKDVIDQIRERHGIQIIFDQVGLRDAAIDPITTLVSCRFKDLALRSALSSILREHNLTFVIRDETLQITTQDKANVTLQIRLYSIDDLLPRVERASISGEAERAAAISTLSDNIRRIAAETWAEVGGPGSLAAFGNKSAILVISQTQDTHEKIERLLAQFREIQRKQLAEDANKPAPPAEPETMMLRVYDLRVSAPNAPAMTPQEVAEVVKGLIEPKSWAGGEAYLRGATGKLIVRQLPSVHREIEQLLDQLGAAVPKAGRLPGGVGGGFGGGGGGGGF